LLISRRFLLGTAVSLVFLLLFFLIVDVGEMSQALATAKYRFILPAIALYFVALFFRSLRWQFLLTPVSRIPVARLFPVVTVGYMANNLLPARLGEIARAYYLERREGLSTSTGLATVVVERIYDGLTLLFLVALAVPFLIFGGLVDGSGTTSEITWAIVGGITALVFITAIVVLTLIALKPGFGGFIERLANLLPKPLRPKARELILLFIEGLSVLREPRRHLGLFLLSLPVWLLEGSMYLIVALSFDLPSYFEPAAMVIPVVILVTAVSNLATSIPSSPGSLGTFEAPAVAALALVGLGAGTNGGEGVAGAYAVLVHVTALLPVTVLGLLYLWFGNLSLSRLLRREEKGYPA
jgi:uncharacterized protein (TIRG00374 family)